MNCLIYFGQMLDAMVPGFSNLRPKIHKDAATGNIPASPVPPPTPDNAPVVGEDHLDQVMCTVPLSSSTPPTPPPRPVCRDVGTQTIHTDPIDKVKYLKMKPYVGLIFCW